nr:chaperone protein dnaJ 49-like [Quercus suber]POF22948.1 chaperone protein dnaj 49 [Quercus suber]
MEGNKDDALKCLRIGKQAMEVGDRSQALKFISKARRLDPTLPVYDLLSEIEKESNGPGDPQPQGSSGSTNNGTSESSKPSNQPSVHHQGPSSSSASSASASASCTEEKIVIMRQIKKKDYYEILGVEKSCKVEDVQKAYRKLILMQRRYLGRRPCLRIA